MKTFTKQALAIAGSVITGQVLAELIRSARRTDIITRKDIDDLKQDLNKIADLAWDNANRISSLEYQSLEDSSAAIPDKRTDPKQGPFLCFDVICENPVTNAPIKQGSYWMDMANMNHIKQVRGEIYREIEQPLRRDHMTDINCTVLFGIMDHHSLNPEKPYAFRLNSPGMSHYELVSAILRRLGFTPKTNDSWSWKKPDTKTGIILDITINCGEESFHHKIRVDDPVSIKGLYRQILEDLNKLPRKSEGNLCPAHVICAVYENDEAREPLCTWRTDYEPVQFSRVSLTDKIMRDAGFYRQVYNLEIPQDWSIGSAAWAPPFKSMLLEINIKALEYRRDYRMPTNDKYDIQASRENILHDMTKLKDDMSRLAGPGDTISPLSVTVKLHSVVTQKVYREWTATLSIGNKTPEEITSGLMAIAGIKNNTWSMPDIQRIQGVNHTCS